MAEPSLTDVEQADLLARRIEGTARAIHDAVRDLRAVCEKVVLHG